MSKLASATPPSNDRPLTTTKKKRAFPEHSRSHKSSDISKWLWDSIPRGLFLLLSSTSFLVFNPTSELSYNDYLKTFHTIALCVGIIDIGHRCQGVYAYCAKLDGRIVFMRHGGELESEFFDMVSWHAPFSHVGRLPNEPRNKIASLCAYYFICAYIVDQIVEIGEFTPEKLKEAIVAACEPVQNHTNIRPREEE
jgi:hypothetical protein